MTIEDFFHDFRQELLVSAEANGRFQLDEFMETVATELIDTGFVDGFELCHYRPPQGGMRVDGYWFNDEGVLDIFIADFDFRNELKSLTKTEANLAFKRAYNFFERCLKKRMALELEVTSPEYGLARQILDRQNIIHRLNLILVSERILSNQLQEVPDTEIEGIPVTHQIWDISRLHRQRTSRSQKEPLDLDLGQMFGKGIACLPAHLGTNAYQSYLMVMPAEILSVLYEKYGSRLLEQNVRTFLQARGNVNKGIRATILNDPGMFFAYNNGITATAKGVEIQETASGLTITRILDLQIVNGGQTTASLFHAKKKDKADLSHIFAQMKLSVIDNEQSEIVVPKISEYANTQNRVNAADFFSNHPFHIRIEGFSRRLWAPASKGAQRETRWFYERARGQYADAQSALSPAEQRRFKIEHPKSQMFTKTDLAKFENVWDDHPRWVNLGSQKNFARFATRIGSEWENVSDGFNEFYFKRAIARAIIFRTTEKTISVQPWYNGGYRANIVAYTLAMLGEITKRRNESIDFLRIWNTQKVDPILEDTIAVIAGAVQADIINPPKGISNISEWCKRESCWTQICDRVDAIIGLLSNEFFDQLISLDAQNITERSAKQLQRMDNGIEAQSRVLAIPAAQWARLHQALKDIGEITPKESGILKIAMQIPMKLPTEKQSQVLLEILKKGQLEGIMDD